MKTILMSDRPKWCALMMNGDKTIEVRKGTALYKAIQKLIDEYGYADIYVYCTKGKPYLGKKEIGRNFYDEPIYAYDLDYGETFKGSGNKKFYSSVGVYSINGKVIFKFRCYKVEEITIVADDYWTESYVLLEDLLKDSCLSYEKLDKYLNRNFGCAIHISDLEVFDKPKELSEFKVYKKFVSYDYTYTHKYVEHELHPLTKAPQSWQFIESENNND